MARKACGEDTLARIDVLNAVGRAGVGGQLRVGYLRRRLAWETHGEVVLGSTLSDEGAVLDPVPRTTTLTRMRTAIAAWGAQCGLWFGTREDCDLATGWGRVVRGHNRSPGRAGRLGARPSNVVPFDPVPSVPLR
jgi:hypothetical protein